MRLKILAIALMMIGISFSQDPQPIDSTFAVQFVGTYQCDNETLTIENMKTYLRAVDQKGKVYHFLWRKNLKFNIQNSDKDVKFKQQAGTIRSFEVQTSTKKKIFTKVN
jgi:hypothetical protein